MSRLPQPAVTAATRTRAPLWLLNRYLIALAVVAVAAALRAWPLQALGTTLTWLTFYPAVMVVAIYGGLFPGLLATALACMTALFLGPQLVGQAFIKQPADWLGMSVFVLTGTMISSMAEAMRRAQVRAKLAQEKAEAANKAKSVFLASMSHELRTPLNAILGFSRVLQDDARLSAEQRETLDIINRSGEHLLRLINDVLDMARIESGRTEPEYSPVDPRHLALDLIDLMRVQAEEKHVALRLDASAELPRFVLTDAAKLRQVILNLLGNATKFTPHGEIVLRLIASPDPTQTGPHGLRLAVEVEDTGIGIAAGDQARIFDPFVQVSDIAMRKGTGLGLAITRQQVELLGGQITVDSAPGRGSRFRVELPVEGLDAEATAALAVERRKVVGLASGQPDFRILVVEDEMANWLLLKHLLEGIGFRQLRMAENGAAGLDAFRAWRPHLIWMDIRMPVMDGLEATHRIRALEGGQAVKIVAITASAFKDEHEEIMAAGMNDFIRKPYRVEEIVDCLVRHLGVRFVYADAAIPNPAATSAALPPEALANLSPALREELGTALLSLDGDRVADLVERVTAQSPTLGNWMKDRAARLDYTAMLHSLQTTDAPSAPALGKKYPLETSA